MTAASRAMGREIESWLIENTGTTRNEDGNGVTAKYVTVGEVARGVGCVRGTAKKYLDLLVESGVVITEECQSRAWGKYRLYYHIG